MSQVTDIMLLCRLCSVKYDVNVPIFGEKDNILSKILACLPVKVSPEDTLPKKICDTCLNKLECYYQFRKEAVDTEAHLLDLLSQADELTLVFSSTTNQSKPDDVHIIDNVHIKTEMIDISENKISISETQDSIETDRPEEKSDEQIKDEKPNDVDEPLAKRRKTSETLQAEEYEIHPVNLNLKLTSTFDITEKTKTEEDNPETSDVASDNDAGCTVTAQEDVGNEPDHIDSPKVQGDTKLKDCVVILGDLEGVDLKKYQFVKQTMGESKSSTCTLRCGPCGRNFGNAVSSYINHLITEHSKNEDGGVTSDIDPLSKKITIACKYCDDTFEGEDSLKIHMTVAHPYLCSRCNRVFMNVHQSLLHTKMHFILDKRKPAEYKKYLKMKNLSTDAAVNSDVVGQNVDRRMMEEVIEQKKKEFAQEKKKINEQKRKEAANEQKKKEATNEQKKKEAANEQKKKEAANEQKKKEAANEQKKKEEAKPQPTCSTSNQKKFQQIAAKNVNEPQKNYSCLECKSWFEDCYQLQRHSVAMHRKKPEKRYESIKLFKCVLCAKHYPSKQMLDDHKATHLVDVRTAVEVTAEPKSIKKYKPVAFKIKKVTESKTSEDRASLDNDDVVEVDNDENKKPNLDDSADILDNVEIICNDIEFDNEDTIDASSESQNQYPSSDVAKTLPSQQTVDAQNLSQNSFTKTTETPLQTQNAFPQINLLQPPPLMLSNINKGIEKFMQLLPGNCSVITMPNLTKNTNTTTVPNSTNNQNVLNNANDSKQINVVSVDKLQPCVSLPSNLIQQGNAPIVLNTFLKQNIDQMFTLQPNEPASKFRKIKPKLQSANADKSDPSTSRKAKDEVITVIIERETKVQETKDNGTGKKQIKIVARNNAEKSAEATNREESNLAQAKKSEESNSKLPEATNPNKSGPCIKIDSSDSNGSDSDGKGGHSDDNSSSESQTRDVIEINSSSDESKYEKIAKSYGAQQPLCAICNRRHYARYITMKYLIYICTWCNYTVSVVMKKLELFNKLKSPLATGVLTAVGTIEHSESRLQCNICKLIQKGTEFTSAGSLVVCNLCKLKTASVTAILLSIKEKGRFHVNKLTDQNKSCKATCKVCGTVVKIQTVTYFNQIVICNACRPKLFEIAAVSSSMRCKTDNNSEENTLKNLLLQTRCYICKDMKQEGEIFLLSDKSICVDCKYNITKFAEFLHNLQKSRRCLNCKKLRKGLRLKELSTYCSRCFPHRPNACSECDKSGTFGQCSCKKRAENENSDDEDKLIIDLESESVAKDTSEGQKQKNKKSIRRESNASSSSSIEVVEESALEENSVPQENSEEMPSTSNAEIVPKIFLKPMCSLLEPRPKLPPLIRKINCGICSNKIETLEESNICSGIVTCLKCKLKMDNLDPKTNNFTCFYCSVECGDKNALVAHKDNVHLCPICKKHREHLQQHLKNVVKCQKCEEIFCKKFSLSDHYRQKHDCRWCVVCDTVLRDDYEVLLHRTLVHNQV